MKKFSQKKSLEVILANAMKVGWEVNTTAFDTGSDFVFLRDMYGQVESNEGIPRQIAYNVVNGHFFVYEPLRENPVANHLSESLDDEKWYKELLNLFYEAMNTEQKNSSN